MDTSHSSEPNLAVVQGKNHVNELKALSFETI